MQRSHMVAGGLILLVVLSYVWFEQQGFGTASDGEILTPVSSFSHSHGIAVDVVDAKKVYIATHEGLYLLKEDKDLYRVGRARDDLMGFGSHPTKAGTFFSSGHPARGGNIGFQRTTDGGVSWEIVSAGLDSPVDFHAMAVSMANPSVMYGFFGGKPQRSADEGSSWGHANGAIAPISLSTDPQDGDTVYASSRNGVMVSKDRGDTWSSLSAELEDGAVSAFVLDPTAPQDALAFAEKLGGLGKSSDGGATWRRVAESFGGEAILYLAFSRSEPGVVYALSHLNSVYKSSDRGSIWSKVI